MQILSGGFINYLPKVNVTNYQYSPFSLEHGARRRGKVAKAA
jgi:hypothetical protein